MKIWNCEIDVLKILICIKIRVKAPTTWFNVYLTVLHTQFWLVIIWLSHSFVVCLFGCPTILSCVYFASTSLKKSIVLCWQLTVVTDLYTSCARLCLTHMFPAVDWPNLLSSPNSLVTTKKKKKLRIYIIYFCFTVDEFGYWRKKQI